MTITVMAITIAGRKYTKYLPITIHHRLIYM